MGGDLKAPGAPRRYVWGNVPRRLEGTLVAAVQRGWAGSKRWNDQDLQVRIAEELRSVAKPDAVDTNVPISKLGVDGSEAQIDIVVTGLPGITRSRLLIHLSGHSTPRIEKELLEVLSVALVNASTVHVGVLVVASERVHFLEGRTSFAYCSGPLLALAKPVLNNSPLKGLLFIGLPSMEPKE